jgi:formiminotetrahydrofolate cyclodeaminase
MDMSVWKLTLEEFARRVADGPTPAGVSVSAVAAALALNLVAMSLGVSARRRDFAGDRDRSRTLADSAKAEASRMMEYADEDIAAYQAYLNNRKSPDASLALQQAIDVPLKVARAAMRGLQLCVEGSSFVSARVAPDLNSAAAILAAAMRAAIRSAEANAATSPDRGLHQQIIAERSQLESEADNVIDRIFNTGEQRGS